MINQQGIKSWVLMWKRSGMMLKSSIAGQDNRSEVKGDQKLLSELK